MLHSSSTDSIYNLEVACDNQRGIRLCILPTRFHSSLLLCNILTLSFFPSKVVSNSTPVTNGGCLNGNVKSNVPESAELSDFMAKVSGLLK